MLPACCLKQSLPHAEKFFLDRENFSLISRSLTGLTGCNPAANHRQESWHTFRYFMGDSLFVIGR